MSNIQVICHNLDCDQENLEPVCVKKIIIAICLMREGARDWGTWRDGNYCDTYVIKVIVFLIPGQLSQLHIVFDMIGLNVLCKNKS
jgi:hypothetical protein